jgi:hypothetical protein
MERNIMLTLQDSYKYFTKQSLTRANNVAHRTKRNRALDKKALSTLIFTYGDEVKFPITFSMPHNDQEMRVEVLLGAEGQRGFLDIPFKTFDSLPTVQHQPTTH